MTRIFDENVWITLGGATRIIENDRRIDPRTSKANTMRTKHNAPGRDFLDVAEEERRHRC
jgi:hypothetical protein